MRPSKAAARRLKRARALVSRPYGWTKSWAHKNVWTPHGWVVAYCATGAVYEVDAGLSRMTREVDLTFLAAAALAGPNPPRYPKRPAISLVQSVNDQRSTNKKDVLDMFDRAIAIANGEAQA